MQPDKLKINCSSPFPRKESNENILRLSRPISSRENDNFVYFEVPPTLTKTYMNRNSLYFDLKNYKEKKITNKISIKVLNNNNVKDSSYRNNLLNYTHCVVDRKKIENLLLREKNIFVSKPELTSEKDRITSKSKSKNYPNFNDNLKISTKQINQILHSNYSPSFLHKNFGMVPKYINEFKIRQGIEKEYERLLEEEKNYPKGTEKVTEIERVDILNRLCVLNENLLKELSKFPVSSHLKSIKIQKEKRQVESKINEVDYAIKTFQRSQVFLKK